MAPLRVLAVAEKPSVAKAVAGILSNNGFQTNQGASRYNKLFEFTVPYGGGQCQMTMTSVSRPFRRAGASARAEPCSLSCHTSVRG
jgi:DNA topoisomerase IA